VAVRVLCLCGFFRRAQDFKSEGFLHMECEAKVDFVPVKYKSVFGSEPKDI
jgi:hypothetical protein